jgi:SAM-dependent methyltransferase
VAGNRNDELAGVARSARRRLVAPLKRQVRTLVERAVRPYLEEVVARLSPPPPAGWWEQPPHRLFFDMHHTLHEARTLALADMPPGAKTILSPGASGTWYFDWVEETYGPVERHIGVEAFLPRPADLPPYAEWVVGDFGSGDAVGHVETGSVDLVLSGQNVEHLWPEQMVTFFCEANRVLADDGWLVVDSPNRDLTARYRWSMAEHTVEFTPAEAAELFSLAGFSIERMKGVWLCAERGRLLPLHPVESGSTDAVVRRIALALTRPDDSFIWWAEARKRRPPDVAGLRAAVAGVFERAWDERVSRLVGAPGTQTGAGTEPAVVAPRGLAGAVVSGPSMVLPPGGFTFTFSVGWSENPGAELLGDVELRAGDRVLDRRDLGSEGRPSGSAAFELQANLAETAFGVQVVVRSDGTARLEVPLSLRVSPEPWRPGGR